MVVRRGKIGDGMYRAYKIGKNMESVDRAYVGLLGSSFDLEKIDKEFDISPLNEYGRKEYYERKEYWKTLDLKKRHKNELKNLSKQYKSFVDDYYVSPVLSLDGNELRTGYEGNRRGHRVKGWFRFNLLYPEWFLGLDLPKPPKRLTEVFA